MTVSLRLRLLAIATLTVLVCGGAMTVISILSHATTEEHVAHARDNVRREVEGLRAVLAAEPTDARPRTLRQSGELVSGYLDAPRGASSPLVDDSLARAAASGRIDLADRMDDGVPTMVAAAPVAGGGYVFAVQRVVAGPETRGLRILVLALAVLTLGLVAACLRMLSAVEKGVATLRGSLAGLAEDLDAAVVRSPVREIDEVAGGIAALAEKLRAARDERERLTRELAHRERLAALGRVAAGIAHEVRNPLAAMKLRADLARTGGEATPAVARDLEDIAAEITRLDRLVSDLLVVAGRRAGPKADVDLGELVARRVALLMPWASERNVTVVAEGGARAQLDADAIARAVDNLLRNAVEASPAGGRVAVAVSASGDQARVVFVDQGPGVPGDRADELFEPFFTTKPDGTGLGLALARAVASAHDGTLAYARDGTATRFTLAVARGTVG